MVTALLVVNWQTLFDEPGRSSFWPWAIPTLIGTPLIAWLVHEVARGRRPKANFALSRQDSTA